MIDELSFTIPVADTVNMNGRFHWSKTDSLRKKLIAETTWRARQLRPRESATIVVEVTKATKARYDPANLHPTVKPVVDTLVACGVLPDDDFSHVLGPVIVPGGVDPSLRRRNAMVPQRMRLRVVLLPYLAGDEFVKTLNTRYAITVEGNNNDS